MCVAGSKKQQRPASSSDRRSSSSWSPAAPQGAAASGEMHRLPQAVASCPHPGTAGCSGGSSSAAGGWRRGRGRVAQSSGYPRAEEGGHASGEKLALGPPRAAHSSHAGELESSCAAAAAAARARAVFRGSTPFRKEQALRDCLSAPRRPGVLLTHPATGRASPTPQVVKPCELFSQSQ